MLRSFSFINNSCFKSVDLLSIGSKTEMFIYFFNLDVLFEQFLQANFCNCGNFLF